ncbi:MULTISPECIES: hypothetical protein [Niastella]|uniref:DUF3885 domain-containing protein n=1 Tax=Niastella soli TaxID=2821487 RepID=A0ABS3YZP0_9BACT|nr:hypothetical protein [Niastella soli]MBO9203218.1 hypothetical protein [Niastella soli]
MLGLFKKKLPHCDTLFEKYLSPWYDQEDRPTMTRPDMYVISGFDGQPLNLDKIQYLPQDLLEYNKKQLQTMADAALNDYQHIIKSDKLDLNVLDAVDKHFNRKMIAEIISKSDPKDFSNDYVIEVCEFGAMLGHLFIQVDGYGWLYSHPYFHSIIVHKDTGFGITVFDWAVKKFSEYGVDDGFAAKFQMALKSVKEPK